ncbi:hemolysin family protein [Rothia nasisuis]|uniref:hemolysin family protein n=1 Tax=Rothia nasisuis TaxID=2109647 RepID=UPI001F1774E7|nr:hemolysin family protein [Rothia nasisuis]
MVTSFLLAAAVLGLVLVGYLFTAVESSYTYLPRSEAQGLAEESGKKSVQVILSDPEPYFRSLRIWRVLAEVSAVVCFFVMIQGLFNRTWVSVLVTLLVMTAMVFAFFGVAPRLVGRTKHVQVFLAMAGVVYALGRLTRPFSSVLTALSRKFSPRDSERVVGIFTEDEILEFVDRASTSEAIENDEAEMVQSIFELDETRIRSVMVPRIDMVTINIDEPLDDALSLFLRSGYSRVPVLGDSFDDVRGILYLKDAVAAIREVRSGTLTPAISHLMRPARFEPESKRVMDLLKEMQRESTHVAIVIDEYGGTAGLVTLEDLIEELVGDISDEYDQEKPEITMQEDGTFKISSRLSIWELGDLFGREIDDEDVDTVGGLLAKHLGRVPIIGSEVEVEGIHIRAVGSRGRRNKIGTLHVWAQPHDVAVGEPAPDR